MNFNFENLKNVKFKEPKDVTAEVTVKNVTDGEEPFLVGRFVEGDIWYWGRFDTFEDAKRCADEIGGMVFRFSSGFLADQLGWHLFFIITPLLSLPCILILMKRMDWGK